MNTDSALVSVARPLKSRTIRTDHAVCLVAGVLPATWARLVLVGLALAFVVLGATDLDLGPLEARLGLAAGERLGPLGQVFGYWAPDLWPAQVFPSILLAQFEPLGRPSSAAVRWPAALAGIIAGWVLARRMSRALGIRAGVLVGICWFSSLALIDRSGESGLDLILGLATLATIDHLMARGSDLVAGLWASLAFLAGGWPPLVVIGLAIIVLGRTAMDFSWRLLLPPFLTAVLWSLWTCWSATTEAWAAALTLPLTQKPSWFLGLGVLALGLPWSPFAFLALAPSVREGWKPDGRRWVNGWFQVAIASLVAGTFVPGLSQASRVVALAGWTVGTAACLESAWTRLLSRSVRRAFLVLFSGVTGLWLCVMIYGAYIWTLSLSYYRMLGVVMSLLVLVVAYLAWSALVNHNSRRGLITLFVIAAGLKLVHWGYYVPEWNYRYSQGPWARAIAQWMPRRWTLYTIHDWPEDLAFFTKRRVRQLRSPHYLEYQPGPESKYVLLLPSELENWPRSAPPVSVVAKFQDQSAAERVLVRTAGILPPPFGPNPSRLSLGGRNGAPPAQRTVRQ
ncbi:MAG: hypothetical protein ACHRXM_14615 [Isosphaerales bacterium]